MKKIIAVASFIAVTLCSAYMFTSCGPGHKTTNPDNMNDSLNMPNNNMDTSINNSIDTSQIRNQNQGK